MSLILDQVIKDLQDRELKGLREYGTTVDRDDYSFLMWLTEAYKESLDKCLYLKAAINMLKSGPKHELPESEYERDYTGLLNSGMFYEFYPELSGNWREDKERFIATKIREREILSKIKKGS